MSRSRIHWLGAGLSSGPGIRKLANLGKSMSLWNRTISKAHAALRGIEYTSMDVRELKIDALKAALNPGDIVVSMLPADMHPEIAKWCLEHHCHLVTTSYLSDSMKAMHDETEAKGLSFVNEVGLDPGLDHLFAHALVAKYRVFPSQSEKFRLVFRSYCGGLSKVPNDFRYKFSWSPVGVLRALQNPAIFIKDGMVRHVGQPWKELSSFTLDGEEFEVYPNRNSLPYIKEYGFDPDWTVDFLARSTLRLKGWAKAWRNIFDQVEHATPETLEALSDELWEKYAFEEDEADRVVLFVGLEAFEGDKCIWQRSYKIDEVGNDDDSAMARLVSIPVTFAVDMIAEGRAVHGVSTAPGDLDEIRLWLKQLDAEGVNVIEQESSDGHCW